MVRELSKRLVQYYIMTWQNKKNRKEKYIRRGEQNRTICPASHFLFLSSTVASPSAVISIHQTLRQSCIFTFGTQYGSLLYLTIPILAFPAAPGPVPWPEAANAIQ